jgi:hypothetical protein
VLERVPDFLADRVPPGSRMREHAVAFATEALGQE